MTPIQDQAFTAFVREQGDALLRHARLLFADAGAAEDALQVALHRASRRWDDLQTPGAYIRTALQRLAIDEGRRKHLVAVPSAADPLVDQAPDVAEAVVALARLDAVLSVLPARQRVTVVLRVVEGLSEAETAVAMNCAPGHRQGRTRPNGPSRRAATS